MISRGAVWQARGWWGGTIAALTAWRAQQVLILAEDPQQAALLYGVAIVVLLLSLTTARSYTALGATSTPGSSSSSAPPESVSPQLVQGARRRSRHKAPRRLTPRTIVVRGQVTGVRSLYAARPRGHDIHPIFGWSLDTYRQLAGRVDGATAVWSILVLSLTVGLVLLLRRNVAHPLGGWLWAGLLVSLVLACRGPRRAAGEVGLLPAPDADFFGPGLPRPSMRLETALAAGMLLLALGLRVYDLELHPGIFGDEGEQGLDARLIYQGKQAPLFGYGWWGIPNLYFHIVALSYRLFGDGVVGVRMPSVLSGIGAVWCVYRIGRRLWGSRAGLLAGSLLACSPLALQFSRFASVSGPTGALWAAGFLYFVRGLSVGRSRDWAIAGIAFCLSLYFYPSGKLSIPLVGLLGLYAFLRWRGGFLRRHGAGFAVLIFAFALTLLPYAIFSMQDDWRGFLGRAQETSILTPENREAFFARHEIQFDPAWRDESVVHNLLAHSPSWARVLVGQLRVTLEVFFRHPDPTAFYQIREHSGSMLAPFLAAITLLGLVYSASKPVDGRYALVLVWFFCGLLGPALTSDTPSVQRLTGAYPATMLFPAAVLDRIACAAWPLSRSLARRWSSWFLSALIGLIAVQGYREYFEHYRSLCPYCDATVPARYVQSLGSEFKAYSFGIGEPDTSIDYGSIRLVAKGVEGTDVLAPASILPVSDLGGKGAAFMVYPQNRQYLPLLKTFYPAGSVESLRGADGIERFTALRLTAAQVRATQTVQATYQSSGAPAIVRNEPGLGTLRARSTAGDAWSMPRGLEFPVDATWIGTLRAPQYAAYRFRVDAPCATLAIDNQEFVKTCDSRNSAEADIVLAKGIHDVRLSCGLPTHGSVCTVRWAAPPATLEPIAPQFLYSGRLGGLTAEVWDPAGKASWSLDGAMPDEPPQLRRSDPFIGFRQLSVALGVPPKLARWEAVLKAPRSGEYSFDIQSDARFSMWLDGREIFASPQADRASLPISAGDHRIEIRVATLKEREQLDWYWTPPGGDRTLVSPEVLTPGPRSWAASAATRPPVADSGGGLVDSTNVRVMASAVLAREAGLREARGVGVDALGQVYIADTGGKRIVRLTADGRALDPWREDRSPDAERGFELLADLAVSPGGTVATIDAAHGILQVFHPDGGVRCRVQGVANSPSGIGMDVDDRVWIADTGGNRLLCYDFDGHLLTRINSLGVGTKAIEQPIDVAIGPDRAIYFVDLRRRIVKLEPSGAFVREWSVPIGTERGGSHLVVWQDRIVMTQPNGNQLIGVSDSGEVQLYSESSDSDPEHLDIPVGIASGANGKLYVVDSGNDCVKVFESLP